MGNIITHRLSSCTASQAANQTLARSRPSTDPSRKMDLLPFASTSARYRALWSVECNHRRRRTIRVWPSSSSPLAPPRLSSLLLSLSLSLWSNSGNGLLEFSFRVSLFLLFFFFRIDDVSRDDRRKKSSGLSDGRCVIGEGTTSRGAVGGGGGFPGLRWGPMHQANGDTRLRAACIDHVDLVARRTRCSATRREGERSKALEGSPPPPPPPLLLPLPPFLRFTPRACFPLSRADVPNRTEPNRDRRDARGREQNETKRNGTSEFSDPCIYACARARLPSPTWLYVYARVFFQRDLLPNS